MGLYLALVVVTLVIGLGAQGYVNHQIKKYTYVPSATRLTGYQMAAGMLNYYGIQNVAVQVGGKGQDFFDPRTNSITLDPDAYYGTSVTAAATACHEVGHACQYAQGYVPMKVRGAMVPVVNFASNAWIFILIIGVMLNMVGLVQLAIAFYAAAVLFQIVTLPVEFNASSRALTYLKAFGLPAQEQAGAANVLRACALTYVAAALVSVLQLLYLLAVNRDE